MPKIKLVDDQLDAIMIKELKTAYKMVRNCDEQKLQDAIEVMLKYYMVIEEAEEAEEWIMRQKRK